MAEGFTIDTDALRRALDDAVWPAIGHFQDTCTQFGYLKDYDLPRLVGSTPNNVQEFATMWMSVYHDMLTARQEMVSVLHEFGQTLEHVYQVYSGAESKNVGIISNAGAR